MTKRHTHNHQTRRKPIAILCAVVILVSLTYIILVEVPVSPAPKFQSITYDSRTTAEDDDKYSFKILCTSQVRIMGWGSFKNRCIELKNWIDRCAKKVKIDVSKPLPLSPDDVAQYDATMVVKTTSFTRTPQMGKVFIDIVDEYHIKEENVPEDVEVIVQNDFQGLDIFPNRTFHTVEHMYNSFPDDFQRDDPEFIPPIKSVRKLSMATVWNVAGTQGCPRLNVKGVTYQCIDEDWNIKNWYHRYMGRSLRTRNHVRKYIQNPGLGIGKLYYELFWKYDVMVVPTKVASWPKPRYGSIQRITSQMRSGSVVLVEINGDAMEKFMETYNYTCVFAGSEPIENSFLSKWFPNWFSKPVISTNVETNVDGRYWTFNEAVEQLKSPELREQCQKEGLEIAKDFSPNRIAKQMLGVFGYQGPFDC